MYENIWLATSEEIYCVPGGRKISTQVHLVQAKTAEEALGIAQQLHEDGYLFKVEPFEQALPRILKQLEDGWIVACFYAQGEKIEKPERWVKDCDCPKEWR